MDSTEPRLSIFDGLKAVIETLSDGYNLVLRRIWLIVLPVALDLYLWFGPRLSAKPLTRLILRLWTPSQQIPEEIRSMMEMLRQNLQTTGQEFNLFSFLNIGLLGMPGYRPDELSLELAGSSIVWGENSSALMMLTLIPVLTAIGLFLGSLYLAAIAHLTRVGRVDLRLLFQQVWRYWGQILLFVVLALGLLIIVGFPVGLVILFVGTLSVSAAQLTLFAAMGLLLWMAFHLFFVPHGIVSETGLFRAVWNSLIVVARNFWSVLFLILLMNLIVAGFTVVWDLLSVNAVTILISIAGNAFVGTGLLAASLIFYQDRLEQWIAWVNQIRSAQQ